MKKLTCIVVLILAFMGCKKEQTTSASINTSAEIKVLQTLDYDGEGLKVKLLEIQDSRCPIDVQCFWAGNIEASFLINNQNISMSTDSILDTLGFSFTLGVVKPLTAAKSNQNYKQKDYILSLLATK